MVSAEGIEQTLEESTGMVVVRHNIFPSSICISSLIRFYLSILFCTGPRKDGKETAKSLSAKEYSQLTVNPNTNDDKSVISCLDPVV